MDSVAPPEALEELRRDAARIPPMFDNVANGAPIAARIRRADEPSTVEA